MQVIRSNEAQSYEPAGHHGVTAYRLHGPGASRAEHLWVGLSAFAPGGGATLAASPTEKVYIVLEGEITVTTEQGEVTIGALDTILMEPNEARAIENRTAGQTRMLVISPR